MTYTKEQTLVNVYDYITKTGFSKLMIDEIIKLCATPDKITIRNVKALVGFGYLTLDGLEFALTGSGIVKAQELKEETKEKERPKERRNSEWDFYLKD